MLLHSIRLVTNFICLLFGAEQVVWSDFSEGF